MTQNGSELYFGGSEDIAQKYHRRSDKQTSIQAAKAMIECLSERRRQFMHGLEIIGGSGTAREVAAAIGGSVALHDSIRRRATDMVRLGFIEELSPRECRVSGRKVTVYRLMHSSNEEDVQPANEIVD